MPIANCVGAGTHEGIFKVVWNIGQRQGKPVAMLLIDPQSLADPTGSGSLVAAVTWLQGTLTGTVATTIAITAVAVTGMLMFFGRIDVRRGLTVVMGCFVLFGASSIAAGIQRAVAGDASDYVLPEPARPMVVETPAPAVQRPQTPYDPYAGASVPPR